MLGRHERGPSPVALAAGGVDEAAGGVPGRVGEHRAGVGPARLVLPPPADDGGQLGLGRRPGPRPPARTRPTTTTWAGADRRAPVAEVEVGRGHVGGTGRRRRARSNRRARRRVPLISEPWPPAFIRTPPPTEPGHADRPLQPGEAGGRGAPGQHRQADRAAGPHRRPVHLDGREILTQGDGQPGEAGVGDEQVRAPADDQDVDTGRRHRPPGQLQVVLVLRPQQQGGRSADPVGGERAEGNVPPGPLAQDRGGGLDVAGVDRLIRRAARRRGW